MGDAGRNENCRSGPNHLAPVRELELDLALEDVPRLVVLVMDVELWRAAALPLVDSEDTARGTAAVARRSDER